MRVRFQLGEIIDQGYKYILPLSKTDLVKLMISMDHF